jgi:argininosuccinate synthase
MNKEYIPKKVVLAYSGGLDTSVITSWLKETYNCEIIAVTANVGQNDNFEKIKEKALNSGASKYYVIDLVDDLVDNYFIPTMQAGAKYERKYLLGTSIARPIIAKALLDIAHKENCDAIVHGCTGKGNDQIRFEQTIRYFDPYIHVIAPWRMWDIRSREDALCYAEKRNIPLPVTRETNYSKDLNIIHLSHEGMELEKPETEPNYNKILELVSTLENAQNTPEYIELGFEKGIPVKLNGKKMSTTEILKELNIIGGKHGIGVADIVENRLVGMKSRGVYENPGAKILYDAHEILESITLDKQTMHYKELISVEFANLVYNGDWFTTLRKALSSFITTTQENVTGDVKLKLYKGNVISAGVKSQFSLHNEEVATFGKGRNV